MIFFSFGDRVAGVVLHVLLAGTGTGTGGGATGAVGSDLCHSAVRALRNLHRGAGDSM